MVPCGFGHRESSLSRGPGFQGAPCVLGRRAEGQVEPMWSMQTSPHSAHTSGATGEGQLPKARRDFILFFFLYFLKDSIYSFLGEGMTRGRGRGRNRLPLTRDSDAGLYPRTLRS